MSEENAVQSSKLTKAPCRRNRCHSLNLYLKLVDIFIKCIDNVIAIASNHIPLPLVTFSAHSLSLSFSSGLYEGEIAEEDTRSYSVLRRINHLAC